MDSDLFGTAGVRGPVADAVTPSLALRVGRAAAEAADGAPFVVGRDGRVTGDALVSALAAGLQSGGAPVTRVGQVPTPALAFASRGRRGAMLTASHNPPADNGIKLFVDGVEYDRDAEESVETAVAADPDPADWDAWTSADRADVLGDYREAVVDFAAGHGADPDGLPVVADCGNGAASLAVPQVLTSLGAEVTALNANLDGHFPGRESKPTAESLDDCRAFVADSDAALGLAHDGDADRIVVLDGDGEIVHEDTIVAVLAHHYVAASDAADPMVVTTPNASARIDDRVEAAGGRTERVRLGGLHEGVAAAEGTVVFAAEPWKHIHTAFGGWMDGVVSAAVLVRLVAAAGSVDALRDPVRELPYRKVNVACADERKAAAMAAVPGELASAFPDAAFDESYGVRATRPDGSWVLVRPSGTEPYLRIYAEGEDVEAIVDAARGAVETAVDRA
ncbi:MAG: phosphomannomutase [Halobacteriaceae archaeon]